MKEDREVFRPSREIAAVVNSIIERNHGFEHKMAALPHEDRQKLDKIAADHKTTYPSVVKWARRQRGVKVYTRVNGYGVRSGEVNFCAYCGAHLTALRKLAKLAFCPGCGKPIAA